VTSEPSKTADDKEIARFNALAATWWDSQGPMWPLHRLNQFRIKILLQQLAQQSRIDSNSKLPLHGKQVLDIGCGGGILSESLAKLGAQVVAIDLAENNTAIARQHAAEQGVDIDYRCQEAGTFSAQFDLVFNMEVVEHVANLEAFLEASCQHVKPGGLMFLSTINRTLKSYLFAILGAEYVLKLLPKGTHQWSKFVKPATLSSLLSDNGLDTIWRQGVSLNPFNKSYHTTESLAVNYMLAATKPDEKA